MKYSAYLLYSHMIFPHTLTQTHAPLFGYSLSTRIWHQKLPRQQKEKRVKKKNNENFVRKLFGIEFPSGKGINYRPKLLLTSPIGHYWTVLLRVTIQLWPIDDDGSTRGGPEDDDDADDDDPSLEFEFELLVPISDFNLTTSKEREWEGGRDWGLRWVPSSSSPFPPSLSSSFFFFCKVNRRSFVFQRVVFVQISLRFQFYCQLWLECFVGCTPWLWEYLP